jgi:hypothetical protein
MAGCGISPNTIVWLDMVFGFMPLTGFYCEINSMPGHGICGNATG